MSDNDSNEQPPKPGDNTPRHDEPKSAPPPADAPESEAQPSDSSEETYSLSEPVEIRRTTQTCPNCQNPFPLSRVNCPHCGLGADRLHRPWKPATWSEIFTAGANREMVLAPSFSMMGSILGAQFVIAVLGMVFGFVSAFGDPGWLINILGSLPLIFALYLVVFYYNHGIPVVAMLTGLFGALLIALKYQNYGADFLAVFRSIGGDRVVADLMDHLGNPRIRLKNQNPGAEFNTWILLALLLLMDLVICLCILSTFCHNYFRVLHRSALGYEDLGTEHGDQGLLKFLLITLVWGVFSSLVVVPIVVPIVYGVASRTTLPPQQVAVLAGASCLAFLGLLSPIYLVKVTLSNSYNPLSAIGWVLKAPFGYFLTMLSWVVSNLFFTLVFCLVVGLWYLGLLFLFGEPKSVDPEASPDVVAGDDETSSPKSSESEQEDRKTSPFNPIYKRLMNRKINLGRFDWFGKLLIVIARLLGWLVTVSGIFYLPFHFAFTQARMLGLFARRYEKKFRWHSEQKAAA